MGRDFVKQDNVNSPAHYQVGGIETWEILKAKLTKEELIGYCKGNCIKYLTRANHKNGSEDYLKSGWYMDKLNLLVDKQE